MEPADRRGGDETAGRRQSDRRLRSIGDLSAGSILQAVAIVVAAIAWLVSNANTTAETRRQFEVFVAQQAREQNDFRQTLSALNERMNQLAELRARLEAIEHDETHDDARLSRLEAAAPPRAH
jgi:septal ring factor EnvC (AmiA/AmiB activator)